MILTLLDSYTALPQFAELADVTGCEVLDLFADVVGCPSTLCESEDDKKRGAGFILAEYKSGAASKNLKDLSVNSKTEVFCYDIDKMTLEDITKAFPVWMEYSVLLYSTFKHTPDKPRYRLLIELSEPVSNNQKFPYHDLYMAGARLLHIKADPKALDRARFFFGPQHRPGITPERIRFEGRRLDLKELGSIRVASNRPKLVEEESNFDIAQDHPSSQELKKFISNLRKSSNDRKLRIGAAMDTILRGEPFAPVGSNHNTALQIAFELVRTFPYLDGNWFADKYLRKPWESMWPEGFDVALKDWRRSVESAKEKHAAARSEEENEAKAKKNLSADSKTKLSKEQRAEVRAMAGKLIMSHRGTYYVYSAWSGMYRGPFKAPELAVAVRDLLGDVPGVSEIEFIQKTVSLKSATRLNYEYGTTAESVLWFAKKPPKAWDEEGNGVCLQAYRWINWEPVYHQIADDLLRAVAGKHYDLLERYLYQFRNLDQTLPALTFIGPRSTWKSRICEILSRFWTTSYGPAPGKAEKIMTRFNGHLVKNPVIWSDERLAVTYQGQPQPEAYRESITDRIQTIEIKGVDGIATLVSAVRHVIAVNNDDKIFSSEVDADSIYATMERFLLFYTDTDRIAEVEKAWLSTPEMDRLRSGESLLEHIRWIEENKDFESQCRLFVKPHTDAQVLLRARFSDDTLHYIWQVAISALDQEGSFSSPGQIQRLPLIKDSKGRVYISPGRIHDLWSVSKVTAGARVGKPSSQKIGQILTQAGFKAFKDERASKNKWKGWQVNVNTLKEFLRASDFISWADLAYLLDSIGLKKDE